MNWFSERFSRAPAAQILRLRKKVKEPHGDPAPRINACQKLLEMGTPEAYRTVLGRFNIHVSPSRRDEEEKEELLSWIIEVGEEMTPALIQFLRGERQVYWPVEALRGILPEDRFKQTLQELLRYHWENPPASSDPKTQLLRALGDLRSPQLDETIRPYLEDDDDDVLLATLDYLFAGKEEQERTPVLQCYLDCEDRPRVRSHILEKLVDSEWNVKGFRPKLEESLPENYKITRDAVLKRVGPRPS